MSDPSILERNLLALSANHPELGRAVTRIDPAPNVGLTVSRTGSQVPVYLGEGRPVQLHSTVDPQREGRRFFHNYGGAGYLVFLGLGNGALGFEEDDGFQIDAVASGNFLLVLT